MPDTPLNPDALEAAAKALFMRERKYHTPSIECPEPPSWEDLTETSMEHYRGNARAVLAVAQPVVTSVEELDALPAGSYVQGWDGFKHAKTHSGDWVLCVEHTRGSHNSESIELPARVLYRPSEEGHDGR